MIVRAEFWTARVTSLREVGRGHQIKFRRRCAGRTHERYFRGMPHSDGRGGGAGRASSGSSARSSSFALRDGLRWTGRWALDMRGRGRCEWQGSLRFVRSQQPWLGGASSLGNFTRSRSLLNPSKNKLHSVVWIQAVQRIYSLPGYAFSICTLIQSIQAVRRAPVACISVGVVLCQSHLCQRRQRGRRRDSRWFRARMPICLCFTGVRRALWRDACQGHVADAKVHRHERISARSCLVNGLDDRYIRDGLQIALFTVLDICNTHGVVRIECRLGRRCAIVCLG